MSREVVVDWWDMHPCPVPEWKCKLDHTPDMVKARLCEVCDKPFVPKHWEDRYNVCQLCHYGSERAV